MKHLLIVYFIIGIIYGALVIKNTFDYYAVNISLDFGWKMLLFFIIVLFMGSSVWPVWIIIDLICFYGRKRNSKIRSGVDPNG